MNIESASVKVMRSYDYCHFEVCLSATSSSDRIIVDDLRKEAARLADKAVAQYKIAKANIELAEADKSRLDTLRYRHRDILNKAETDRTPQEKALVKAMEDRAHWNRRRYDYEDDFEEVEPDDNLEEADDELF